MHDRRPIIPDEIPEYCAGPTSATNNILHLEERDQATYLDVIQDFFAMPSCSNLRDSECQSSDNEADMAGKIYELITVIKTQYIQLFAEYQTTEECEEEEVEEFVDVEERVQEMIAPVIAGEGSKNDRLM